MMMQIIGNGTDFTQTKSQPIFLFKSERPSKELPS